MYSELLSLNDTDTIKGIISREEAATLASKTNTFGYLRFDNLKIVALTDTLEISKYNLPKGCVFSASVLPRTIDGVICDSPAEVLVSKYPEYHMPTSLEAFNKLIAKDNKRILNDPNCNLNPNAAIY